MRILLYTPAFPPQVGGMETSALRLAQGLTYNSHDVVVMTDTLTSLNATEQWQFSVLRRPTFAQIRKAATWADVVHLSGYDLPTFVAAKLARRPVVWEHHDYGPCGCFRPESRRCGFLHLGPAGSFGVRHWPLRERVKDYTRTVVRLASLPWVDANVVMLPGHRAALPFPHLSVIPHGIDCVTGQPVRAARPQILFHSRHAPGKGGHILLQALAQLSKGSVRAIFGGDGPARRQWESLAASLGLDIEFRGFTDHIGLTKLYLESDIVVVPTVYAEYVGLVALEAMACGAYVVGSSNGGLGELLRTCGAATFPPGDDIALAQLLSELLQDRTQLAREGERLRAFVRVHYPHEERVRLYGELYQSLRARGWRNA